MSSNRTWKLTAPNDYDNGYRTLRRADLLTCLRFLRARSSRWDGQVVILHTEREPIVCFDAVAHQGGLSLGVITGSAEAIEARRAEIDEALELFKS